MDIYKMRINPKSDEEVNPIEFCREKEIVGVGHELYMDQTYDTLEELKEAHREYEKEHYENHTRFKQDGDFSAELRYILKDIDEGDYIWSIGAMTSIYVGLKENGTLLQINLKKNKRSTSVTIFTTSIEPSGRGFPSVLSRGSFSGNFPEHSALSPKCAIR